MLIVGGNVAGVSAAIAARKHNQEIEIVLLEESGHAATQSSRLPESGPVPESAFPRPMLSDPQRLRSQYRVDVRIAHSLDSINLDDRVAEVVDAAHGRAYKLAFRELIFATGAKNKELQVPRDDASPPVVGAHSWGIVDKVIELVKENDKAGVLVLGGSPSGLSIVDTLLRNGLRVVALSEGPTVIDGFDPAVGRLVETALRLSGVEVYLNSSVSSIDEGGVTSDVGSLGCQLVVVASELQPNTGIAKRAALPLGDKEAITVNARHAVVDGIWAAGDCCDCFHVVAKRRGYYPDGMRPALEGAIAGTNAAGGYRTSDGVVDVQVGRVCGLTFARCGVDAHLAQLVGYSYEELTIRSNADDGYWSEGSEGSEGPSVGAGGLFSKLLLERGSGRILGAQLVGPPIAEGIVDFLAFAVAKDISLDELLRFDLGYSRYLQEHMD